MNDVNATIPQDIVARLARRLGKQGYLTDDNLICAGLNPSDPHTLPALDRGGLRLMWRRSLGWVRMQGEDTSC